MKHTRIGIPRALLYFRYGARWSAFLSGAGCEVITSPETNAGIITNGVRMSVGEFCLPVKIFLGHVDALKDGVDRLFIPRYVSDEPDAYHCPKIIGLPDVVRASFSRLPEIVSPLLHVKRDGSEATGNFLREAARLLGLEEDRAVQSWEAASAADHRAARGHDIGLPATGTRIAVIGRDYLLFDRKVGQTVFRTLRELGVMPVVPDPDAGEVREAMTVIPKWVYWSMGKEVVASAHTCFKDSAIRGVINVCSAACGPDSFTGDLIRKRLNTRNKPYLSLSFDEHTSDVGVQTRIEAFVDMMLKVTA